MLHEIKNLVIEEPKYWLDIISVWRKLHGHEGKTDDVSRENTLALKRKSEEETNTTSKRQKTEQVRAIESEECRVEAGERCVAPEKTSGQECWIETKTSSKFPSKDSRENPTVNEQLCFSFRVSCRCSGAIAKILTSQEIGRAIGIALVKQCGWRADLREPDLEIFVHLNDIHSVVGIPLFRLPLANREYIKTAGLRSTVAWAMASLAEISIKLISSCCAASVDPRMVQETSPASSRKVGVESQQSLALPLPSESFDSVISDIPFGKKFKIANDTQLLPAILQEMERVLRVGGILVLLLSQDLRKCVDGLTKCAGSDSPEATADGDSKAAPAKAPSGDGNSSSSGHGVGESFLSSRQLGSLVPDGVYAVSLGKTDAFIHKYRKLSAAGNWSLPGTVLKGI